MDAFLWCVGICRADQLTNEYTPDVRAGVCVCVCVCLCVCVCVFVFLITSIGRANGLTEMCVRMFPRGLFHSLAPAAQRSVSICSGYTRNTS